MEQTNVPGEEKNQNKAEQPHLPPPPPPPPPRKGVENEDQGKTPTNPIQNIINIQQPELGFWRKFSDPMAIIQLLIALITLSTLGWYIHSSKKQMKQTNLALGKTDSSLVKTQKSLVLTDSSNSIAKQSLIQSQASANKSYAIAKQTMDNGLEISKLDLRPWVCFYLDDPLTTPFVLKMGVDTITVPIKNFGKTPAFDVAFAFSAIYKNSMLPKNLGKYFKGKLNSEGTFFLPPGETVNLLLTDHGTYFTQRKIDSIRDGKLYMFLLVRLTYSQRVGGIVIPHTTDFSIFYDRLTKIIQPHEGFNNDK